MAWTNARILLNLFTLRIQRQSFASTRQDGSNGQRPGPIGTLESESGEKLNMDGFPIESKGTYMECLFSKWLQDQRSIHGTWHRYFKDLVDNRTPSDSSNTPSDESDANVTPENKIPGKATDSMFQKQIPEEPEKAADGGSITPIRNHKRTLKYPYSVDKFGQFRRQASSTRRIDKCLQRAQNMPGSKRVPKKASKADSRKCNDFVTVNFKSFYEEQLNKEKAKRSKLRRGGVQDISKENKFIEKPETKSPQEKPQPSHRGEDDYDPNPNPKTLTYKSLDDLIDDLDNATINMARPDPIHQKIAKKVWNKTSKLWKNASEKPPLTDCALTDLPEKSATSVWSSLDRGTEDISSENAGSEDLGIWRTKTLQSPLGDVNEGCAHTDTKPSRPSADP